MTESERQESILEDFRNRENDARAMHCLCCVTMENAGPEVLAGYARLCVDISASGPYETGWTPLHFGARHGHVQAMHMLLQLGARVDATDRSRATALHVAVQYGQHVAVELLTSARADLGAQDWVGKTPLHHACDYARMNGYNTVANMLIAAGADVHSMDRCWCTPAMLAMDNTSLVMNMIRHSSRPSPEIAYMYADRCRGSEKREKLLEILVKYGWAPSPSSLNSGNNRWGGATTGNNPASSEKKPGSSHDEFKDTDKEAGQGEDSLVHAALLTGDVEFLVEVLDLGADPHALNASGLSPLHVAAHLNAVAELEALLGAGALWGCRHAQNGLTALHMSAMGGHVEVTEALLAAAVPSSSKTTSSKFSAEDAAPYSSVVDDGTPSPRTAASIGNKARPPLVIVDVKDDMNRCPLHLAALSGSTPTIEVLLQAGARVDSRDKRGRTPLFLAASEDNTEAVKALLNAGASPSLRDSSGSAPLHKAVLRPAAGVVEALIAGGASPGVGGEKGLTPLHAACESNARGTVEALLRAGAVPGHCWNIYRRSPLMVACGYGNLNAVELLVPRLSARQINKRSGVDDGGTTPIFAALLCEDIDESETIGIVEALLKAGADPTLKTRAHLGPLEIVLMERTKASPTLGPRLVRALVAAGADVNGVCGNGLAPLHFACLDGVCGEVVQALLDAGADACMPCAGMRFMTPLQFAGMNGNVEAVSVLLEHPAYADLNTLGTRPSRATVLACAVQHGKTEVCRFLLERGADMSQVPPSEEQAGNGNTLIATSLIELAAQLGHLDVMNLLIQAKMLKDNVVEEERVMMGNGGGTVRVS